jgi:hypothetical protein
MSRRSDCRRRIAAVAVLCICIASLIAPCGEAEPPFDRGVRDHLVRAGYLNPLDILVPFDAASFSDRCRLPRTSRNCSCESAPDRIAASSGFRARL